MALSISNNDWRKTEPKSLFFYFLDRSSSHQRARASGADAGDLPGHAALVPQAEAPPRGASPTQGPDETDGAPKPKQQPLWALIPTQSQGSKDPAPPPRDLGREMTPVAIHVVVIAANLLELWTHLSLSLSNSRIRRSCPLLPETREGAWMTAVSLHIIVITAANLLELPTYMYLISLLLLYI